MCVCCVCVHPLLWHRISLLKSSLLKLKTFLSNFLGMISRVFTNILFNTLMIPFINFPFFLSYDKKTITIKKLIEERVCLFGPTCSSQGLESTVTVQRFGNLSKKMEAHICTVRWHPDLAAASWVEHHLLSLLVLC